MVFMAHITTTSPTTAVAKWGASAKNTTRQKYQKYDCIRSFGINDRIKIMSAGFSLLSCLKVFGMKAHVIASFMLLSLSFTTLRITFSTFWLVSHLALRLCSIFARKLENVYALICTHFAKVKRTPHLSTQPPTYSHCCWQCFDWICVFVALNFATDSPTISDDKCSSS